MQSLVSASGPIGGNCSPWCRAPDRSGAPGEKEKAGPHGERPDVRSCIKQSRSGAPGRALFPLPLVQLHRHPRPISTPDAPALLADQCRRGEHPWCRWADRSGNRERGTGSRSAPPGADRAGHLAGECRRGRPLPRRHARPTGERGTGSTPHAGHLARSPCPTGPASPRLLLAGNVPRTPGKPPTVPPLLALVVTREASQGPAIGPRGRAIRARSADQLNLEAPTG